MFEEFVKGTVQRKADEAREQIDALADKIASVVLPETVRTSIERAALQDTLEGEQVRRFITVGKLRYRALMKTAEGKSPGVWAALPARPDVGPIKKRAQDELIRLRAASDAAERQTMTDELAELESCHSLSPHRQLVAAEVARLRAVKEIDAALEDCKTYSITHQAGIAEKAVITDLLRANFQGNLSRLGFAESPVEVELATGERGKRPYKMQLSSRPTVPPAEVLSEGERTCVALAGFLAELETTENRSAIVLDDPVSSLDHNFRQRVGERLVRESKVRQVIILTHDLVFLYFLRKAARDLGFVPNELSLIRGYKRDYGRAVDGPPWPAMSVNQRVGALRRELADADKSLRKEGWEAYEKKASEVYKKLRKTWERAVEEVLLNQIVVRFGDEIQTQRLKKVADITDDDVEMVTNEMSRCSTFEHDASAATHARIPEPDTVAKDIDSLEAWVKELRQSRGRQ
jgi:ATPase subunit of ABC transporter with duplicated ATPase domains